MEVAQSVEISRIEDFSCLQSFQSGVKAMDDFIHNGFAASVRNHYCQAYAVRIGKNIVAIFALSFDSVDLDTDDKDDLINGFASTGTPNVSFDYQDTFWAKPHYPALDIAYLAVSQEMQGSHIGQAIIEEIADRARRQTFAGCQFLTVEAYVTPEYRADGFYRKCGFTPNEVPKPYKDTLRMFRTLYPNE